MGKYKYTPEEQNINNVLTYQSKELESINFPDSSEIDKSIADSEKLLQELGYNTDYVPRLKLKEQKHPNMPSWEELCEIAIKEVGNDCQLEYLFTEEELRANEDYINRLNAQYNSIHKLDKTDIAICVAAGLLSSFVDIVMVGTTEKAAIGLNEGSLSDWVRKYFEKKYPKEEMEKLANSKRSKVPYDAQYNKNKTNIAIEGLSTKFHRLVSLGHDPLLGFVVGVMDIKNGTMTTVDKLGHYVSQPMEMYSVRKEADVFKAIAKQLAHLKSDINTPAGLPVPFMGLFNFCQFGSIAEEDLTIAEIVQSMYGQGYDFIHFCSMSIPVMITEVFVRIAYSLKMINNGYSITEAVPYSNNHDKFPKLETMLFASHSLATVINAGKVYFTKNPMNINYPQWLAFVKYSYKQLKWALLDKPELCDKYVCGKIDEELTEVYESVDDTYQVIFS